MFSRYVIFLELENKVVFKDSVDGCKWYLLLCLHFLDIITFILKGAISLALQDDPQPQKYGAKKQCH